MEEEINPESTESPSTQSTDWHRMVGVIFVHVLENTPFKVEADESI